MELWHIIHDGSLSLEDVKLQVDVGSVLTLDDISSVLPAAGEKVILYLSDDKIKEILPIAIERDWEIMPLPHLENHLTTIRFGLESDLKSAINNAIAQENVSIQLLTCNGIPVLSSVMVGETLTLDTQVVSKVSWSLLGGFLKGIKKLRPVRFTITTDKDQKSVTAGIGIIALAGPGHKFLGAELNDLTIWDNARSTILVLAPRSILEYFSLIFKIIFVYSLRLRNLPSYIGLIRSRRVVLETVKEVDFTVDGVPMSADHLELEAAKNPMRVRLGRQFPKSINTSVADKDIVRVKHLPSGETIQILSEFHLPFFNHASEDEFRDLFLSIKESAVFSRPFISLMVMSALLALFGLYANSAPVIIGAMILSPLMGPIISLSMGVARSQSMLISESLKTLAFGILVTLLCAMAVALMMPFHTITSEMAARLTPNLLDLGVAVISGVAGAYANAKEEIAKSLAGVAIAVALVPPLCMIGVGLGWMDREVVRGATLLFATNLVGIAVAGSMTFLALGFAPFNLARNGLIMSLSLLAMVSVPLYFSFGELIEKNSITEAITKENLVINGNKIQIEPIAVYIGDITRIRLQAISQSPLNNQDLESIKSGLTDRLGRPLTLEISVLLKR
ncbi:MAG: TIGR00341 family protein [Magnetococcales bacterium]|nr:TIGR00341 family protein [Magnetococcales bacterium]